MQAPERQARSRQLQIQDAGKEPQAQAKAAGAKS